MSLGLFYFFYVGEILFPPYIPLIFYLLGWSCSQSRCFHWFMDPRVGWVRLLKHQDFFYRIDKEKCSRQTQMCYFWGLLVEWTSSPRPQTIPPRFACIYWDLLDVGHFLLSKIRGNLSRPGSRWSCGIFSGWNCWSPSFTWKLVKFQPAPFGSTWTLREALSSLSVSEKWLQTWSCVEDFFYLPMNRRHRQGIGYAFINFQAEGTAKLFKEAGGSDRRLDGWNFLIRKRYTKFTPSCCRCVIQSFCCRLLWSDFHKGCRKGKQPSFFESSRSLIPFKPVF